MGASMASPSPARILCAILCICSLQTGVMARRNPKPKTIELTYYLMEIRGGPGTNGTIFAAAGTGAGNSSAAPGWGTYFAFDCPLHESPTFASKALGKSTGLATVTNKGGIVQGGVQIYCQHIYGNQSIYQNSSITVEGQVDFITGTPPWECIVPGGTGYFRGYRGYGLATIETSPFAALIIYKWQIFLSR